MKDYFFGNSIAFVALPSEEYKCVPFIIFQQYIRSTRYEVRRNSSHLE